jgi:hypothetical protein
VVIPFFLVAIDGSCPKHKASFLSFPVLNTATNKRPLRQVKKYFRCWFTQGLPMKLNFSLGGGVGGARINQHLQQDHHLLERKEEERGKVGNSCITS